MKDLKIRVLPSDIHSRFFELLGSNPIRMDLTQAIEDIQTGALDAQENPYTNTTTYGVHNYHKHHTLSNHFYISRAIMCNRSQFYLWPEPLKQAIIEAAGDAMRWQRTQIETDVRIAEKLIIEAGGQIHSLTEAQTALFQEKIAPLYTDAREQFGNTPFDLLSNT
jgi:TRAP-type C4-dicarboxylate transport system substrate-binding protein